MSKRWIVCIILTLVCIGIFLFSPTFNWGGQKYISMYQQYVPQGQYLLLFKHLGGISLIVFLSLIYLIVIRK